MKLNRRLIAALTTLSFCVVNLIVSPPAASAGPSYHTLLEVRQANGQWGDSRTVHSLTAVDFQWKTEVPNTSYGQWQMFDYSPGPHDLSASAFAVSGPLAVTPFTAFKPFKIDFAQLQQQHPDKIPTIAPAEAKQYYVRLVPWKNLDMTDPNNIAGNVSLNMKITYVKSATFGTQQDPTVTTGFTINGASVNAGGLTLPPGPGIAVAVVTSSKPSSLVFQVSESAPVLDSHQRPSFPSGTISASEHISSFNTRHMVGVFGLKNNGHYFYIIEARDSLGNQAFNTGDFETHSRVNGP